jgi:hypothetical protein
LAPTRPRSSSHASMSTLSVPQGIVPFTLTSCLILLPSIYLFRLNSRRLNNANATNPAYTQSPLHLFITAIVLVNTLYLLSTLFIPSLVEPNVFREFGISLTTPTEKIRMLLVAKFHPDANLSGAFDGTSGGSGVPPPSSQSPFSSILSFLSFLRSSRPSPSAGGGFGSDSGEATGLSSSSTLPLPPAYATLITRMGSLDMRLLYVRFGHNVIANCEYCLSFDDFALFGLVGWCWGYVIQAAVCGVSFVGSLTFQSVSFVL